MRTKNADGWGGGTRLLAAVAVLVMVLCAFVALVPAADAEGENPSIGDQGSGIMSAATNPNNNSSYTSPVTTEDGIVVYSVFGNISGESSQGEFEDGGLFAGVSKTYRYVSLSGIVTEGVTIKQTNTALNEAYPGAFPEGFKEKTYTGITDSEDYCFLIPTDHSDVIIEVTSDAGTVTYVIECAGVFYENGDEYSWTLTEDVALNGYFAISEGKVSINLSGHKLVAPKGVFIYSGTEGATIVDGTIESVDMRVLGSSLSMESVIFNAVSYADDDDPWGIGLFNSNKNETGSVHSTLVLTGCTINVPYYAITGNNLYSAGSTVTVKDSVLTATDETCIYIPMESTVTIENSKVVGPSGIEIKMGTLNLINAEVEATAEYSEPDPSGNGTVGTGYALLVSAQKYGSTYVDDGNKQYMESPDLTVTVDATSTFKTVDGKDIEVINCKNNNTNVQNAEVTVDADLDKVAIRDQTTGAKDADDVVVTINNANDVVLSGDADVIIKGDATVSGTVVKSLTISDGGAVTVGADSTLEVGTGAKVTVGAGSTLTVNGDITADGEDKPVINVSGEATVNGTNVDPTIFRDADASVENSQYYPDMEDGSIVNVNGIQYVVAHAMTQAGEVQFGIAVGDLTYNGQNRAGDIRNVAVTSLDNDFTRITGVPSAYIYDESTIDEENPYGICRDAGQYSIHISFAMTNTDGSTTVTVDADTAYSETLKIEILSATPDVRVDIEDWTYDTTPAIPVVTYNDGDVPADVYVTYSVGDSNAMDLEALTEYLSTLTADTYTLTAHFSPAPSSKEGYNNYSEASTTCNFTVSNAVLSPTIEVVKDGTFTGSLDITDGNVLDIDGIAVCQTEGDYRYIVSLSVTSPVDGKVTFNGVEYSLVAGTAQSLPIQLASLANRTVDNSITLVFSADGYESITYTVDYANVYRNTVIGYAEDSAEATEQINAAAGTQLEESDVSDKTMWMIFDRKNTGGDITASVTFEGKAYTETISVEGGYAVVWYFSFAEDNQAYNAGLKGEPGAYELVVNLTDTVAVTGTGYVDGMIDSGFGIDKDEVTNDIYELTGKELDNVIDKTLWFAWYQGAATENTVISLYKGTSATGTAAYTEPADGVYSFGQGIHVFYASFDHQLSDLASDPIGNWYVVVKDGDSTIAEGPVKVEASPSEAEFHAGEGTYYGKDVSEIQNGVSITVDKDDNTAISVTGEVFRLDSWPEWGNGPAGYYLALRVNDSEFDWSDAVVKLGSDPENLFTRTAADGLEYYVLYLGEKLTGKVFTFIFDYDGEGKFYEPTTYTVDTSGLTASYHEPEYWIVSALEYGYEDYEYNGTYSVINDKIVSYYTTATAGEDLVNVMNDFARYMGALYRYSEGEIYQVTFMKTSYTWDSAKGLKGSNWVDSEGNTLVSAVVDYVKANGVTAISMEVRGLADPGYKAATFTYAAEISDVPFVLDYDGTEIGVMPGNTTAVISYTGTVPKGQYFAGWECDGTVYQPGDVIVPTGDMKFTVRFEPFPVEKVLDIVGAGFYVNAETAQAVLAALGSTYTGGVDDNTIFLIFEMAGYGGSTVDVQLVFGETVVITASAIGDDFTSKDGVKTWLISWENQLRDVAETTGDYTFNVLVDGEVAATKTVHVRFAEEPVTYTVTFGDDKMEGLLAGDLVNVPDVGEGYIGWNLDGVIYTPGSTYVVTGDVDFVAEPAPEAEKSLTFIGAGFYEDADIAKVVLASMGSSYTGGVDDNTMLIVFANSGYTELRGYLLLNGVEVYDEALLGEDGVRTWLFSDLNPAPGFVNGTYTIEIRSGTEVVLTKDIDVRLTPAVEPETFTVTFGDTVISGLYEGDVIYVPSYTPADGYEFVGWDLEGTVYAPGSAYTVTGDAEFTAVTKEIVPEVTEYDVYWICDGEVLDIESYSAGTYPQYHGAVEPSMTETDLYTYTFTVWKDARGVVLDENGEYKVTGTTVFIAQFEEERKPIVYGDSDVTLSSTAGGVTVYLNSENGAVKPGSVKIAYTYSYFNERRGTYAYAVAYTEAQPVTNVDGSDRIVLNFDLSELPVYAEIVKLQAVYTMEDGSTTYSDTILYTPAVISRSD